MYKRQIKATNLRLRFDSDNVYLEAESTDGKGPDRVELLRAPKRSKRGTVVETTVGDAVAKLDVDPEEEAGEGGE